MRNIFFSAALFLVSAQLSFSQSDTALTNGVARQKEGKHAPAIWAFSNSIKVHEEEVQVFLNAWDEYQKVSEFDRAEKGMTYPPIEVAYARAYYLRGKSYAAMNQNGEALNDFTIAIKIDQKSGAAYYERGKILWTEGKKYEGCYDLSVARSLKDSLAQETYDEKFCWNEAVALHKDAITKLKLNQFDIALELIRKSIQLAPDSAAFLVVRGKCYSSLEKLDLAFADFDKAIAALPDNLEAYFGRGMAFLTKRKFQEAFDDFDKAIRINGNFADAYLNRAYACEGMNKVQSALYDYQQVQRLKPRDPLAYYKSGLLKQENGDAKGACADFKKAASLEHPEAADYAKDCK